MLESEEATYYIFPYYVRYPQPAAEKKERNLEEISEKIGKYVESLWTQIPNGAFIPKK